MPKVIVKTITHADNSTLMLDTNAIFTRRNLKSGYISIKNNGSDVRRLCVRKNALTNFEEC